QRRFGWVSPGALGHIARRMSIPLAEVYGVATFYALLNLEESPPVVVHVCDDIACRTNGGTEVIDTLERRLGPPHAHRNGARATWARSPCLGLCERAPAAMIACSGVTPFERGFAPVSAAMIEDAMNRGWVENAPPTVLSQPRSELRLLARVGAVDPGSIHA